MSLVLVHFGLVKICAHLLVFIKVRRYEGAVRKRSLAERVVWERRAPASAHGARQFVFYTLVQANLSNAVF